MISGEFDYKKFVQELVSQMPEVIPNDILPLQRQFLIKITENFCLIAAKELKYDKEITYSTQAAMSIVQIIAIWTFNKAVDLSRTKIPAEFYRAILAKIAFTIYEICKQIHECEIEISSDKSLQIMEEHVTNVYKECIEELENKDILNNSDAQDAKLMSNIDLMAYNEKVNKKTLIEELIEGVIFAVCCGCIYIPLSKRALNWDFKIGLYYTFLTTILVILIYFLVKKHKKQ